MTQDRPLGNDVALNPNDRQQLVDPFAPTRGHGLHWQDREPRERMLDFASLVRILQEHRWLIAGATGLGLVLAVISTLMTTPMYRADVTLEVNAPSVEILDEKARDSSVGQQPVGHRHNAGRPVVEPQPCRTGRPKSQPRRQSRVRRHRGRCGDAPADCRRQDPGRPQSRNPRGRAADRVQLRLGIAAPGRADRQRHRRRLHQFQPAAPL